MEDLSSGTFIGSIINNDNMHDSNNPIKAPSPIVLNDKDAVKEYNIQQPAFIEKTEIINLIRHIIYIKPKITPRLKFSGEGKYSWIQV